MFALLAIVLWIVPGIICISQGNQKNRAGLGWICALFLGWIGVVIMLILEPYNG
jgi:hypothetical protein